MNISRRFWQVVRSLLVRLLHSQCTCRFKDVAVSDFGKGRYGSLRVNNGKDPIARRVTRGERTRLWITTSAVINRPVRIGYLLWSIRPANRLRPKIDATNAEKAIAEHLCCS